MIGNMFNARHLHDKMLSKLLLEICANASTKTDRVTVDRDTDAACNAATELVDLGPERLQQQQLDARCIAFRSGFNWKI